MIPSEPEDHGSADEVRRVIRLGRTTAYCLAREYLVADGRSDIPVVRIGRKLHVQREEMEDAFGVLIEEIPDDPE